MPIHRLSRSRISRLFVYLALLPFSAAPLCSQVDSERFSLRSSRQEVEVAFLSQDVVAVHASAKRAADILQAEVQAGSFTVSVNLDRTTQSALLDGKGASLLLADRRALRELATILEQRLDPYNTEITPEEDLLFRTILTLTEAPLGFRFGKLDIRADMSVKAPANATLSIPMLGPRLQAESFLGCMQSPCQIDSDGNVPILGACVSRTSSAIWHDADTHCYCREEISVGCELTADCPGRCGAGCGSLLGAGIYAFDCAEHDRCCRVHGGCINPSDAECGDEYTDAIGDTLFGPVTCHAGCEISVSLDASPSSGSAPLEGVHLTATLGSSSTLPVSYTFYCDRADDGKSVVPGFDARFENVRLTSLSAPALCDYQAAGTYSPKVVVEHFDSAAEARTEVTTTVDPPPPSPPPPPPPSLPGILTLSASAVGQTSAVLNLAVDPAGNQTIVWFGWGPSETSLDNSTPAVSVGSGTTTLVRSAEVMSLSCNTTYYFQAWADGYGLPVSGEILSFRTTPCPDGGGTETEELIRNGTFADDDSHWSRSGSFFADGRFTNHHSAPGYAYLSLSDGTPGNNIGGDLVQEVTIPAAAESAEVSFWRFISTTEQASSPGRDLLTVSILNQSGEILETLALYTNHDATFGYVREEFNLDEYIGKTVQVLFRGSTSLTEPTIFRIDDVSLLVTYSNPDSSFDLVASNPSVDDPTPTPGSKVRMSITTGNVGDETAPSDVEVTYFLDGVEVAHDNEETALAPGESDGEAESFFVPNEHGTYSAWACLDSFPEEASVSNNCTPKIDLVVGDDPSEGSDLIIVDTSASKTTVLVGESFQMSAEVVNVGNLSSDLTAVHFLASVDGSVDLEDFVLEDKAVNRLSPGRDRTETETMTPPPEPGTYLVGGCILGRSSEINTANNCSPDPFQLTVLPRGCSPETIALAEVSVTTSEVHEACHSIAAGPNTLVEAGGSLELTAPTVVLNSGFRVAEGGRLVVNTPVPPAGLEDDFNDGVIDTDLWTTEGSTVREEEGLFKITTEVTDAGGAAESREMRIDPTRTLVLERRVRLHYANDKYGGGLFFDWVGFPEFRFGVNYSNYDFDENKSCPTFGISISRNNANAHQCPANEEDASGLIPGVWDQWFDERVVYDPTTGAVDYYINGALEISYNVGPLPAGADTFFLKLSNWGWHTGHEHFMDHIRVDQE